MPLLEKRHTDRRKMVDNNNEVKISIGRINTDFEIPTQNLLRKKDFPLSRLPVHRCALGGSESEVGVVR